MSTGLTAIIQSPDGWLSFAEPVERVVAQSVEEVLPALSRVAAATAEGLWAAGYIAYEAAPAFDDAFRTHDRSPVPRVLFGLYRRPQQLAKPPTPAGSYRVGGWRPSVEWEAYRDAIDQIKAYIASGDTYQVNYTHRLGASFEGDPYALATDLWRAQGGAYGAFLDDGEQAICSASPELFVELTGPRLVSRPMKGTARRGLTLADDRHRAEELAVSPKDRAENLMIVDMVRNDLGRIARIGSVEVPSLFEVERYETVWQMTSTVRCRTDAPLVDILAALFPCASITGAPKIRTMEIIRELEPEPRGVYTGVIGYLAPGRRMRLNVAIRTVVVDRAAEVAAYGVGGGIVWDSDAAAEYQECASKALVLTRRGQRFDLLETMLWEPVDGVFLWDRHLSRLADSAEYFGYPYDTGRVTRAIEARVAAADGPLRLRLLLAPDGRASVEAQPLPPPATVPWRCALADEPIDPTDPFLYHKTTRREVYERARAARPDVDDVLLWNPDRGLTEFTIGNLVARLDGELVTPPVTAGLLPGTFRGWLLERGEVREAALSLDDLPRVEGLYLVNSVRRWVEVALVEPTGPVK